MSVIVVDNLSKDYGHNRGIFNVSFEIDKGQCFGFLGPNGAGKTTTIRHLMGFSKAESGKVEIMGQDCWEYSSELKNIVGYLPGEISFPAGLSGNQFLDMMANMRKLKDRIYLQKLVDRFVIDTSISIDKMSLGDKRKLAVVTAFMHDPQILILDEPTSGLDPIMQDAFIDFVRSEKGRGKTILLSSHIFKEVEATCDRIAIIKEGRIVDEFNADRLNTNADRLYSIVFYDSTDLENFLKDFIYIDQLDFVDRSKFMCKLKLKDKQIAELLLCLADKNIADFTEDRSSLEEYFMKFYESDNSFQGVTI